MNYFVLADYCSAIETMTYVKLHSFIASQHRVGSKSPFKRSHF